MFYSSGHTYKMDQSATINPLAFLTITVSYILQVVRDIIAVQLPKYRLIMPVAMFLIFSLLLITSAFTLIFFGEWINFGNTSITTAGSGYAWG